MAENCVIDSKVDHLIVMARLAQDLLPVNTIEGRDISRRLSVAIDEVIRTRSRQTYIKSNAERGIQTIPMQ
jgi:hypothetical protein